MQNIPPTPRAPSPPSIWPYISAGIVAHLFIGSYPVFGKRALAEVPKYSLVLIAAVAMMATAAVVMRRREGVTWRQFAGVLGRERVLWVFAVVIGVRAVTNIIAIALTQAVWVGLISMLAPFAVALLGSWVFGERTPRFTYSAAALAAVGAVLMLVQDWTNIAAGFTRNDVLGLLIAALSMVMFAFYYQLIRRSHLRDVTSGLILFQQGLAMAVSFLIMTIVAREDWRAWGGVSMGGWLAVLAVIFIVQVGGNLLQITAVGGATPALITNFMALRLVSALVLAGLILGEQLAGPIQWLGAALVVGTVTIYLWLQRKPNL